MSSILAKLFALLRATLSSPATKAAVKGAAPIVETALTAAAHSNPVAEVVVQTIINPAIESEAKKVSE